MGSRTCADIVGYLYKVLNYYIKTQIRLVLLALDGSIQDNDILNQASSYYREEDWESEHRELNSVFFLII